MVTIWRDRWVTKPQDKTKKAGSSFLVKLGGGWEEGGEKRARKEKVRVWVRRPPCYVVLRNVI